MKNLFLTIICCTLLSGSMFSQPSREKSNLFEAIKILRFQYKAQLNYLNAGENFGEGARYSFERIQLSETKAKLEEFDKAFTKVLSEGELKDYLKWKRKEEMKDKMQDMGWWYTANQTGKGC